jgi:aspartyl-tRNA(Asn)/glutamyl-tRNA(Gln) amidotransferase subunit A
VPTTASSRVLEGHDPGVDAAVWERLRAAGAGLLGKTTLHEFAYGTGSPRPATRGTSPGRRRARPGGSGAALAAAMVPVATGSTPAAPCASPPPPAASQPAPDQGRVSTYGALPLSRSLDTTGRWPGGCATSACCWPARRATTPRPRVARRAGAAYPDAPREDLTGVRIGTATRWFWDDVDPPSLRPAGPRWTGWSRAAPSSSRSPRRPTPSS